MTTVGAAESVWRLCYGLDDRCSIPGGGNDGIFFSPSCLGLTQPPIQWVPVAITTGGKRPGREAEKSLQSSAVVKNAWRYNSTPQLFTASCL